MPKMKNFSNLSGKLHSRPRNVYQQKTTVQFMCRVCLTKSNDKMHDLHDKVALLEETYLDKCKESTVQEALEKVTASKV